MSDFLLNGAGKVIDLGSEVPILKAIGKLCANLEKLRDAGLGGAGATGALLTILRTPQDPAVVSALTTVGLGDLPDSLRPLAKFADRFEAAGGGLFLEPLIAFDRGEAEGASYDWDILGGSTARDFRGIGLSFEGSLSLRFEADKGELAWTYSDRPQGAEHLLALTVAGLLKASAGFRVPFSGGSVSGNAGGEASASLTYLFDPRDPDRTMPVAALFARNLERLPSPFALDQVSRAIDAGDLVGLRMNIRGTTRIFGKVAIGFDEEIAAGVKLTGGAEVSVSSTMTTGYELSVKAVRPRSPGASHHLDLSVSRHRLAERDIGFGLGVELDLSELTARVREVLVAKIGLARGELSELRPFLSPGTLLRQRLGEKLGAAAASLADNAEIARTLKSEVAALFGTSEPGQVQKFLQGQLTGLLSRAGALGTKEANELAASITDSLPEPLRKIARSNQAKAKLKSVLEGLIKDVRGEVEGKLGELADTALDRITGLVEKAGLAVGAAGGKADKAFAGLCQLADRIDSLAGKIVTELENPVRTQVKIKIAETESRWNGRGLELAGKITSLTPEAIRIFQAIQTGAWEELESLFRNGGAPGFELKREASRLSVSMGRKRTIAIHAIVLGFGSEFDVTDLATAEIVVDGFGNVTVMSKGELSRHLSLFGRKREVRFTNAFAIVAAAGSGEVSLPTADLGFAIEQRDRKFRRHEAEALLLSMASLAGPDIAIRAGPVLDTWFGKGRDSHLDGLLTLRIALSGSQIDRLLELGSLQAASLTARERIFEIAVARTMAAEGRRFQAAGAIARQVVGVPDREAIRWSRLWPAFLERTGIASTGDVQKWSKSPAPRPRGGAEYFGSILRPRIDLNDFVSEAQSLMRAALMGDLIGSLSRLVALGRSAAPGRVDDTLRAIRAEQEKLVDINREWLTVGTNIVEIFSSEVAQRNVLLLEILSALLTDRSIGSPAPPLSPAFAIARSAKPLEATAIAPVEA